MGYGTGTRATTGNRTGTRATTGNRTGTRATTIPAQLLENRTPVERTILVGAPPRGVETRVVDEHMEELRQLTLTAGGEVVATVVQRLESPNRHTYIGGGKVEELAGLVAGTETDLVIVDEELKPGQAKNLETALGVRVMDRSELILDIFASRARTREARIQVELAQLEYLLPRLARMWTHLSRIRGGIGLRGPGETQIETDRRLIGQRIAELRKKLVRVAEARQTQRRRRRGQYRVALVGYTNAGKSSVLKALSGDDLFVEDRLFATLDSATRQVQLGCGYETLVTDTVGFIRKLPHHLVASFRSTLEEAREADLLVHVVNVSRPEWEEQQDVVEEVLEDLDLAERPQILLFNQVDRVTHEEEAVVRNRMQTLSATPCVFGSAIQPGGLDALRDALRARIRACHPRVTVELPVGDGALLARVHREGEVLEQKHNGSRIRLTARLPEALVGRLGREPLVRLTVL